MRADYCLNSIPTHLLAGIPNNFPADYSGTFTAVPRGKLLQARPPVPRTVLGTRAIYGGIWWTAEDITQIWYPSHGIHRKKGVLLAAYIYGGPSSDRFADLPAPERLELAISQGEKVHPDYRRYIESGVSVAWHRMNHMLGCAAEWNAELYQRGSRAFRHPLATTI